MIDNAVNKKHVFLKISFLIKSIDSFFYNKFKFPEKLSFLKIFNFTGGFLGVLLFIALFYFIPVDRNIDIMIISAVSFILNTVIVFILKYTVRRKRIVNCYEKDMIKKHDPYSFPSGHSARLSGFILASVYFPAFSFVFIFLTLLISALRISSGYHYFSDCIAGIIIGLLSGMTALIIYGFIYAGFSNYINLL